MYRTLMLLGVELLLHLIFFKTGWACSTFVSSGPNPHYDIMIPFHVLLWQVMLLLSLFYLFCNFHSHMALFLTFLGDRSILHSDKICCVTYIWRKLIFSF